MKHLKPEEKIYFAFYSKRKDMLYFNEIRELTSMSISSLQNAILKLEKNKEINKVKEKAHIFYKLKNEQLIALNFTKFDITKTENLNINIKIPLKKFLSEIPKEIDFIMLFGSASRKQEKKESDIDLLIVLHNFKNENLQKEYEKEIKNEITKIKEKINAISNHSLSLFYTNTEEFINSKDRVIKEAKQTGFCIYNNLNHYGAILKKEG